MPLLLLTTAAIATLPGLAVSIARWPQGSQAGNLLGLEQPAAGVRRRAFAASAGKPDMSLASQCLHGYVAVVAACGQAPAGQYAPSQCTAWCQLIYVSWWPKCQHVREYATIEAASSHALSGFYTTCQAAAKPTCSPCPGSASARDVLPLDEHVLSPGSVQAVD